jgi:hypothetical protein
MIHCEQTMVNFFVPMIDEVRNGSSIDSWGKEINLLLCVLSNPAPAGCSRRFQL